jgi:hypothetical protein
VLFQSRRRQYYEVTKMFLRNRLYVHPNPTEYIKLSIYSLQTESKLHSFFGKNILRFERNFQVQGGVFLAVWPDWANFRLKVDCFLSAFLFARFSHRKRCLLILTKPGLGYSLGDFFTNWYGHPAFLDPFKNTSSSQATVCGKLHSLSRHLKTREKIKAGSIVCFVCALLKTHILKYISHGTPIYIWHQSMRLGTSMHHNDYN